MRMIRVACSIGLVACSSDQGGKTTENDGGAGADAQAGSTGGASSGGASSSGGAPSLGGASSAGGAPSAGGAAVVPPGDGSVPPADTGATPTGPNVDRTGPMLHEFELEPQELDSSVVDSLDTEYAQLDTRSAPLGKFVIFLPGFTNVPGDWRNHGRKLAEFGFHVAIPSYNNRWSGCSGPDCNRETRWEALTGEDTSTAIVASRADSVEGRVITILEHLVTAHPGGDWGYYMDGSGGLLYERIIIAGISHGAANTGVYASRRAFWRAVMHSGGWGDPGSNPLTPLGEWYAFAHTDDPSFDPIVDGWDDAGMLGSRTSIDGASAPFGDAHKLITSEANTYPHCSVAVHSSSPMSGGAYAFEPAWRHLYGVAELTR